MGIDDLGKKLGQHCQANAEIFLTIRGQRAYAEVTSEQADRALAKPFVPDGVTINVERHEGEVPLIKVGLRPSLTAVPKGQVSQAIIRAFGQLNAGRLGRIYIGPDAIHVPVSTEACLKRLLKAGSIDVVGKQLAVFDPSVVVREKRLQDLVEMHFLRKSRGALKQLQDQHAVVIAVRLGGTSPSSPEAGPTAPSGRGRGRGGRGAASQAAAAGRGQAGRGRGCPAKAAGRGVAKHVDKKAAATEKVKAMEPVVEVKGSAKASVDRAMSAIESLLAKATRRQSSFSSSETRFSTLLYAKIKELGQTDPEVAVFTARQPGGRLVVHMMGSDSAKVEALSQRPSHYMAKLTVANLQLNANQFKRVQVAQLTKAYGVLIEYDAKRGEVTVFGPREAAKACIEDMKPVSTAGGGQAQKAAAPQQLTLTSGRALFFKEHIHVNYRQLRVRPLKKGAIVVTGPSEELDVVEHLVNKIECRVLPHYLSPELADGFADFARRHLARLDIVAVVTQSLVSNDDGEDNGDNEEEEEKEKEGNEQDVTYLSNCGHEDEEWAQLEVWCYAGSLVPTFVKTMGFFASEQHHLVQELVPSLEWLYESWTHVDTINRIITCVSFQRIDDVLVYLSSADKWGNGYSGCLAATNTRLVYAVSPSALVSLEPMLQQFGVEYLTYTTRDNHMGSMIVTKLMETFGLLTPQHGLRK
ncbi:uncharacterized protein ACA1_088790 [Acanthamoeba castellanii str. Neff]|uniref:Uncharacterized protein n=1 Tax=Acanthamoeba castellanii (strain ATCC 30010 / Neff) TaxID=1257118 RepID=L8GVM4_ACACF|nr:uncharacterized protein ACA1_088790 [Acanthamoeba castellanii str. Neff]ELR16633.1 hypothetical protein ACA1_088790 [Acanthamoeba castellanii str. Neff]